MIAFEIAATGITYSEKGDPDPGDTGILQSSPTAKRQRRERRTTEDSSYVLVRDACTRRFRSRFVTLSSLDSRNRAVGFTND